jgi:hypothetical protein
MFRAVVEAVMAGDRVKHFETEILRKDGMPMQISMSMCPVFDGDVVPVATVLVARDITEQRLAQATLGEVEARVRESEAMAHVGSWLWDRRTGAVQWSDEFHRIHGVDPLDFDGRSSPTSARFTPRTRIESAAVSRSPSRAVARSKMCTASSAPTRTSGSSTPAPSRRSGRPAPCWDCGASVKTSPSGGSPTAKLRDRRVNDGTAVDARAPPRVPSLDVGGERAWR